MDVHTATLQLSEPCALEAYCVATKMKFVAWAQARAQVVTCSVSISKIGSSEIALLMQGKTISATMLD